MKKIMCFSLLIGIILVGCSKNESFNNPEPNLKMSTNTVKVNKVLIVDIADGFFDNKKLEYGFRSALYISKFGMDENNRPYCIASLNNMIGASGTITLPKNIKSIEGHEFKCTFSVETYNVIPPTEIWLQIWDGNDGNIDFKMSGYFITIYMSQLRLGDSDEEQRQFGSEIMNLKVIFNDNGGTITSDFVNLLEEIRTTWGVDVK